MERYLGRLRSERGCSPHTLAGYRLDLRALAAVAGATDARAAPDWAGVTEHRVRQWVAGASRAGLSPRSIARHLSAWRGFFDWLALEGRVAANPARAVRAPRAPRRLPTALAPDV
ncbi:MAG: site-specific integrase, partial [Burkholderiaceae bacterium]|nr:site-specific integrase [Burkholderiaceae bacterium]